MRTAPAFLIAPLPSVIVASALSLLYETPARVVYFCVGLLVLIWLLQLVVGSLILWLMRRSRRTALRYYAFGGTVMIAIGLVPIMIPTVHLNDGVIEMLSALAAGLLIALGIGAPTGLLFGWLTRGNADSGSDLADLRQRFE